MRQKKLNLTDLEVDTFETLDISTAVSGTVRAHEDTRYPCTNVGTECTVGGEASQYYNCGDNTHYWQDTCGQNYTCNNHSCWMTAPNCHCNFTDGECTWGANDTCAGANPPCPV